MTMKGIFCFTLTLTAVLLLATVSTAAEEDDLFISWFNDQTQEVTDTKLSLTVDGTIPGYLCGKLIRVGPTKTTTMSKNYSNFLDGFGRVTSWSIDGARNTVDFQSSIIKSLLWNHSKSAEVDKQTQEEEEDVSGIASHICQEKTEPATTLGPLDLHDMDNTDVNVYQFPGESNKESFLSFTDFYLASEIHLDTLRTLGSAEFVGGNVPKGAFFSSSHPAEYVHPITNRVYLINWLGVKTLHGSTIYIYAMDDTLERSVIGSVEIEFLPYSIHSVSLVDSYLSIVVAPVSIDFLKTGATLCLSCAVNDNLDSEPTMIYVFSMETVGQPAAETTRLDPVATAVYNDSSFFTFHHINGWTEADAESDDTLLLTLDVCSYYSMAGVQGEFVLGNLADIRDANTRNAMPYLCDTYKRLQIRVPKIKSVASQSPSELRSASVSAIPSSRQPAVLGAVSNYDLPLVDADGRTYRLDFLGTSPLQHGKHHCFVYGVTHHVLGSSRYEDMGLVKVNTCIAEEERDRQNQKLLHDNDVKISTPSVINVWHLEGVYIGEPIFVPNPDFATNENEDAGSLLVVTRHSNNITTSVTKLMIFDSTTFEVQATVEAPFALMFEFHGQFFPKS